MNMKNKIVFDVIIGSQAYGTAIDGVSDIDKKGVYIQDHIDILCFKYQEQLSVNKDEFYYEVRRFLELLQVANPTCLEMIFSESKLILKKEPVFDLIIANRDRFLTQKCYESFGKYAESQIKKAKGLNKKMNWENSRVERKTPLDFCYVYENGQTKKVEKYLEERSLSQKFCGLVALDHFRDCYALYYDFDSLIDDDVSKLGFHGVIKDDSNDIRLSSVPKGMNAETIMIFNKDHYSKHCNDYLDYQTWLKNRNTQRYVDIAGHNQRVDGKNLLHCRRLLDVAMEIATDKTISVRRPNADYLLKIRRGEVSLEEIIDNAEKDLAGLEELYLKSGLPKECDAEFVNDLLVQIRNYK
jgi:hypothetical protein